MSESDVNMLTGTDLTETAGTKLRRAVVNLPRKRRSKSVCETVEAEAAPVALAPSLSRRARMKRSGPMSLQCRKDSDDQQPNKVRISPEVLSAFDQTIGTFGKSSAKHAA